MPITEPLREIGRTGPNGNACVDRGTAAKDFASQRFQRTAATARGTDVPPVMSIRTTDNVGIGQVRRVQVRRIGSPGFQEHDATRVAFAQTICEDRTG